MRNSLIFVLVGTILIACSGLKSLNDTDRLVKQVTLQHVVAIKNEADSSHCSSVFVRYKGKVRHVTNSHCCQQAIFYKGSILSIIKDSPEVDLCEVSNPYKSTVGISMANNEAQIADRIYIAGYPIGGHDFSLTTGFVSTLSRTHIVMGRPIILTNAFATFGNSGGAVVSTDGYLVGILSVSSKAFNHGGYVPLTILKYFLN